MPSLHISQMKQIYTPSEVPKELSKIRFKPNSRVHLKQVNQTATSIKKHSSSLKTLDQDQRSFIDLSQNIDIDVVKEQP